MNINKKIRNKILSLSDFHYSLISTLVVVLCFFISSNNEILGDEEKQKNNSENIKQQNATLAFGKDNFIAVGDWYCNKETEKTIENILAIDPEVILTTGDHVKDEKSADCWIKMSEKIKDKMKIAIGNHDKDSSIIYKQITRNHNLITPYYSHDFKNIHFISLSTEHPFEEGSKQYEFIKSDLEKTSNDTDIEWIIVHQHKPLYSTKNDKEEAEELRVTYHPLFEKYNVDLVISSHNQYYERTYPLLYNSKSDANPIIKEDNFSSNYYHKSDGIIFLTVGTAGDELHDIEDHANYYVMQDNEEFGFLNLELENNGKTLIGKFHTNKGDIMDHFELKNI